MLLDNRLKTALPIVVPELDAGHIERRGSLALGHGHNVRGRNKEELRLRIYEFGNQPRARDSIDFYSLSRDPLHLFLLSHAAVACSESKPSLHLEAPVISRLSKEATCSRRLVCLPEQRRSYVPDDRTRDCVVEQVANRHRERQVVPPARRRRTVRTRAARPKYTAGSAPVRAAAPARPPTRSLWPTAKPNCLGQAHVHHHRARPSSKVSRQDLLTRCRVRIQQPVFRHNQT